MVSLSQAAGHRLRTRSPARAKTSSSANPANQVHGGGLSSERWTKFDSGTPRERKTRFKLRSDAQLRLTRRVWLATGALKRFPVVTWRTSLVALRATSLAPATPLARHRSSPTSASATTKLIL